MVSPRFNCCWRTLAISAFISFTKTSPIVWTCLSTTGLIFSRILANSCGVSSLTSMPLSLSCCKIWASDSRFSLRCSGFASPAQSSTRPYRTPRDRGQRRPSSRRPDPSASPRVTETFRCANCLLFCLTMCASRSRFLWTFNNPLRVAPDKSSRRRRLSSSVAVLQSMILNCRSRVSEETATRYLLVTAKRQNSLHLLRERHRGGPSTGSPPTSRQPTWQQQERPNEPYRLHPKRPQPEPSRQAPASDLRL